MAQVGSNDEKHVSRKSYLTVPLRVNENIIVNNICNSACIYICIDEAITLAVLEWRCGAREHNNNKWRQLTPAWSGSGQDIFIHLYTLDHWSLISIYLSFSLSFCLSLYLSYSLCMSLTPPWSGAWTGHFYTFIYSGPLISIFQSISLSLSFCLFFSSRSLSRPFSLLRVLQFYTVTSWGFPCEKWRIWTGHRSLSIEHTSNHPQISLSDQ